jgi:hypothetical protein
LHEDLTFRIWTRENKAGGEYSGMMMESKHPGGAAWAVRGKKKEGLVLQGLLVPLVPQIPAAVQV